MTLSKEPVSRLFLAMAMASGIGAASASPEPAERNTDPAQSEKAKPSAEETDAPMANQDKKDEGQKEGWRREGLALKNGKSTIKLSGYAQEDFRRFDWKVGGDESGLLQAPHREFRRLRVGVEGEIGDLSFEFGGDPRNSQKGDRLKDATVGYQFTKRLKLLVGHFKPRVGQEFPTSSSKTDFVDRGRAAARLTPDRDWGVGVSGELGRFEYAVGAFMGDGDSGLQSAGRSGAGRLGVDIVKGLRISGSFMQGEVRAEPRVGTTEPSAKGASGTTASGFTFWNRPHVNGTRRRLGSDVSYSRGPFRFQAEYLEAREQRKGQGSTGQDIPDVLGRGWNAQASYVLTGEKKGSTVEPRKSIFKGGPGAVELAARVEALTFDDTGDPSGFAGFGNRARNISPSGTSTLELGLNYWASSFLKFQGNAVWESYNDPLIAPEPGNKGRYFTLLGRIQVMIP